MVFQKDGVLVKGLFLQGAGWDQKNACLVEAEPMQLVCPMPTIHFKPVEAKRRSQRGKRRSRTRRTRRGRSCHLSLFCCPPDIFICCCLVSVLCCRLLSFSFGYILAFSFSSALELDDVFLPALWEPGVRGSLVVCMLDYQCQSVQIPTMAEIWFEISVHLRPLANSSMMSTLTTRCQWED